MATLVIHTAPKVNTVDEFDILAKCESGGNSQSVSPDGKYFGAFQFDQPTWEAQGQSGLPTDYSYSYQKSIAIKLEAKSGWTPWPICGRGL